MSRGGSCGCAVAQRSPGFIFDRRPVRRPRAPELYREMQSSPVLRLRPVQPIATWAHRRAGHRPATSWVAEVLLRTVRKRRARTGSPDACNPAASTRQSPGEAQAPASTGPPWAKVVIQSNHPGGGDCVIRSSSAARPACAAILPRPSVAPHAFGRGRLDVDLRSCATPIPLGQICTHLLNAGPSGGAFPSHDRMSRLETRGVTRRLIHRTRRNTRLPMPRYHVRIGKMPPSVTKPAAIGQSRHRWKNQHIAVRNAPSPCRIACVTPPIAYGSRRSDARSC